MIAIGRNRSVTGSLRLALLGSLVVAIALIDRFTMLGLAAGILYVAPLLVAQALASRRLVLITMVTGIGLTLIGLAWSPPPPPEFPMALVLINRLTSMAIILLAGIMALNRLSLVSTRDAEIRDHAHAVALLDRTRTRFNQLANAIPAIVWTADAAGRVRFINRALADLTGRPVRPDRQAAALFRAIHPNDRRPVFRAWQQAVASGEDFECEVRLGSRSQGWRWHIARAEWIPEQLGRGGTWYGTASDVDDQKRLEGDMRTLAQRLTTTLESITDGFYLLDPDWRFSFINHHAEAMFGQPREELIGRDFWAAFPEVNGRVLERQFRHAVRSGSSVTFEYQTESGGNWFAVNAYPSAEGLAVYLRDISIRKQSEKQLLLLQTAISRINDMVLITKSGPIEDPGPEIVYVNDAFEKMTGYSRQEIIGKSPRLLQGPDTSRAELDRIRGHLERFEPVRAELLNYTKHGQQYWIELDIVPIADEFDRYTHFVAVERNITERLAMEEQLRQSQRLEAIGQLTGGIAHDFNNLLTVIMGNSEMLRESLDEDSHAVEISDMITTAAQRGSELTQRLLAFARRQPLKPQPVDLNRLVAGMEALLRRSLGQHIEIEMARAGGLWLAMVDRTQLESALLNLCINGRDAMPGGGRLTIETANARLDHDYAEHHGIDPGQYVMLAVTDNGRGIPADHLDRVFEPFFTTKEHGKGTGLGLSMIYGFVKQSSGHIRIYSEVGEGTTVRIYLPRTREIGVKDEFDSEASQPGPGSETVLVVEDDDLVRRFAREQLESLGYRVVEASDGPSALAAIEREAVVDLLFTDIIMPGGMNGRELADQVREHRPGIKVLFTSGYSDNAIAHQGRLDPDVQLLSKPYRRADLARRIRDVLSR